MKPTALLLALILLGQGGSMKGWELYCWREPGKWSYALLPGTNRLKSFAEVTAPGKGLSLESLLKQLERISTGEYLTWQGTMNDGERAGFAPPPDEVGTKVQSLLSKRGIHFQKGEAAAAPRLGLYLLADRNASGSDAQKAPLNNLQLAQNPLLTEKDFASYNWKTHAFTLTAAARGRLPDPGVHGVPFVLTAYGRRLYLGAFWTSLSSASFAAPVIEARAANLSIERAYPEASFGAGADPRSHPLMKDALASAGVVR